MNNQNALYNCESYEDDYPRMRRDLVIDVRMGVGPQGPRGEQGDKGDAPVKGIDYWTAEDKAYVIAEAESGVIDDVLAAKADAEAARDSAQEAQTAAETAASNADSSKQSAKEYADAAMGYRDEAEQAATAAQTSQGLAETAQSAAETASANASDSETLARNAATDAANAKQDAVDAMLLAQTVDRDIRENLLPTIEGYSTSVSEAKDAAELAQSKAESAQAAAEQAKESAEISVELAETARVAAEAAQGLTEDARDIVLDIADEITATKQDFDVKYNKVDSEYYPAIQEIGVDVSDAKDDVLEAKDWVEKAQYSLAITKDISGNPIEFNDGKDGAFFKQLYVTLSPTMDGSGVPSPSNIRPITGWSEVTLTQNDGEDIVPYTYDWHETAGTIYGGMLNALDGTITVTWTGVVLDGTENWVNGTSSAAGFRTYLRGFPLPSAYNREYCSHLVNVSAGNVGSLKTLDSFGLREDNGILYIYVAGCETVADTKSYLVEQYSRGTPVTVIWELAEPVVYKMDPYDLHTREGFNRIASSVGSITAKYYVDLESAVDEAVDNKAVSVSATASTLPAGSEATASYNAETNVFAFGIPTGATGPAGAAGYSPIATVIQTPDGAVIEITDETGTTSTTLSDSKIWDNLDAETDSYTPQVVIPCDDSGTVLSGAVTKRGRMLYINGVIPSNLRICIYGAFKGTRSVPSYVAFPEWYGEPFDGFVVGHTYRYVPEIISGTVEATGGNDLLVLRQKDDTYKSISAGSTAVCEVLPEAVFVMLRTGTYTNVKLYLHIVDVTASPVTDVQVNGSSVVTGGVASIEMPVSRSWELIREDTVTNATEADIIISADSNGQAFELSDVRLVLVSPQQDTAFSKADYGRVRMYYQTGAYDITFIGAYNQTAGASAKVSYIRFEQSDGMLVKLTMPNTSRSGMGPWQTYATEDGEGCFVLPDAQRVYSRINITKVTGTLHYILYGRRK